MPDAQGDPRSLRQEQVEATRQAIVAVARRRFGRDGYAATSVAAIAEDARVTKGAVYHHFPTKEDLFRAVYAAVEADAVARAAMPAPDGPIVAVDLLVAGVQAYLDAALDPEVQRVTLIDGPAVLGPEPLGDVTEDPGHIALRTFIAAAIAEGQLRDLDPEVVTRLIGGASLQAGLVIARSPDPARTRVEMGRALEAMVRGLAAG
jgi:AcrR family transcriptional regulator